MKPNYANINYYRQNGRLYFSTAAINLHTYFSGKKRKFHSYCENEVLFGRKPNRRMNKGEMETEIVSRDYAFSLLRIFGSLERNDIFGLLGDAKFHQHGWKKLTTPIDSTDLNSVHWDKQQNNRKSLLVKFNGRMFEVFFLFVAWPMGKHCHWLNRPTTAAASCCQQRNEIKIKIATPKMEEVYLRGCLQTSLSVDGKKKRKKINK